MVAGWPQRGRSLQARGHWLRCMGLQAGRPAGRATRAPHAAAARGSGPDSGGLQPLAHWSCRLGLEELLMLLPRKFGFQGPWSGDIRVELRAHHSNLVYVWLQARSTGSALLQLLLAALSFRAPCSYLSPVSPADTVVAARRYHRHRRCLIERLQLLLDLGGVVVIRVHYRPGRSVS